MAVDKLKVPRLKKSHSPTTIHPVKRGKGRPRKEVLDVSLTPTSIPPPKKSPNGKGRPSKFSPEVISRLEKNIGEGLPYELACRLSGISYETYRCWMRDAMKEDADPDLINFLHTIAQAESQAEVTLINKWLNKTKGDWRAAKEYLARRWPERWAERKQLEHIGPGGGPIQGTLIVVAGTPDQYVQALRQARAAITDGTG